MRKGILSLFLFFASRTLAASHGPVFGLATPTNSQGEWSYDVGTFGRSTAEGTDDSVRALIGYGVTPHVSIFFTAPAKFGDGNAPPTRIQPGDDFDSTVAWRFQHNTTRVGTRIESTAFAGLAVPGPQSGVRGIPIAPHTPGTMIGVVSGLASRSHYVWLGTTFTKFYEREGNRRPDVWDYSLVYGYRPVKWRKDADHWDWRIFGELVGERSNRFLSDSQIVPETQSHQVFVGPSLLGIKNNYTISFGAQAPVYRTVGSMFTRERIRYAANFSILLFSKSHGGSH